jgi:hypothetical protein
MHPNEDAMAAPALPKPAAEALPLCDAIERHIHLRTNGRVQFLRVELAVESVVISGSSPSYYVKQLAIEGAREALRGRHDAPALQVHIRVGDD